MKEYIFRKDKILALCADKTVLHLGFVQHAGLYEKKIKENDWLHEMINQRAVQLVGIDYLRAEVSCIKEKYGYDVYCGDVTKRDEMEKIKSIVGQTYQVIVCGDLIEHVENPGLMLNNIKLFMDQHSILIITTPNPWATRRLGLLKNQELEDQWLNKEHVCWYSYQTLKQLLERLNFDEIEYTYSVYDSHDRFVKNRMGGGVKDSFMSIGFKKKELNFMMDYFLFVV